MNDCMIVYIKRDITCSIDNETIMHWFQNMKTLVDNCKLYVFARFFFLLLLLLSSIYEFIFLLDCIIYTF